MSTDKYKYPNDSGRRKTGSGYAWLDTTKYI
jgi:hypothetical protein